MKRRWLIALCALVFCYTLFTQAPLAFFTGRFMAPGAPVELIGIEGGLGSGSAAGLLIRGQPAARDLHWQLRPLHLLIARAAFHIEGQGDGLVFDGKASMSAGKTLRLSDFRASGSVKPLLAAFKLFLPIEGSVGLQADALRISKGVPTHAQGHLELAGLTWKLGRDPIVLGDFVADVAPGDEGLIAVIKSKSGPLDVSGDARLKPDQSYELHLQIRAKAEAPQPLVNMLASLGPADTQGYYHIRRSGRLAPPTPPAPVPAL